MIARIIESMSDITARRSGIISVFTHHRINNAMPSTKGVKSAKMDKTISERRNVDSRNRKDEPTTAAATVLDGDKVPSPWSDESELCADCGKCVLASQLGLQCDGCGLWHHSKCEKINEEIYDFLAKHEDVHGNEQNNDEDANVITRASAKVR